MIAKHIMRLDNIVNFNLWNRKMKIITKSIDTVSYTHLDVYKRQIYDRIDEAFYREKQVQGWSRKKKEALIENKPQDLPLLSRNYTQYVPSTSSGTATSNGDVASTSSATDLTSSASDSTSSASD